MANEFERSLKNTAARIAQYVDDVAAINVDTRYLLVGAEDQADFAQAKPGLRTVIRLDGDCETILPVNAGAGGQLEVNTEMYEIHQRNVQTAIEYRAKILAALLEAMKAYSTR